MNSHCGVKERQTLSMPVALEPLVPQECVGHVIMNRNIITLRNTLSYAGVFVVNGAGARYRFSQKTHNIMFCHCLHNVVYISPKATKLFQPRVLSHDYG